MENATDPRPGCGACSTRWRQQARRAGKTVFELQATDWRVRKPIPTAEMAATVRELNTLGARHIAYYPDDLFQDQPRLKEFRRVFSMTGRPGAVKRRKAGINQRLGGTAPGGWEVGRRAAERTPPRRHEAVLGARRFVVDHALTLLLAYAFSIRCSWPICGWWGGALLLSLRAKRPAAEPAAGAGLPAPERGGALLQRGRQCARNAGLCAGAGLPGIRGDRRQ